MKVCLFGESGDESTEQSLQALSRSHIVTWFVNENITAREIGASSLPEVAISCSVNDLERHDVFVITTPCDYNAITDEVDMESLLSIVSLVRSHARKGSLVLLENVVPVGTTRVLFQDIGLCAAFSPCHMGNVRVVGGINRESESRAMMFYETMFDKLLATGDSDTAEGAALYKYSERAITMSFMNEFERFCACNNIDVHNVIDAIHPRPWRGPWVGKDTKNHACRLLLRNDEALPVLRTAIGQLERRPKVVYEQIVERYCGKQNYDELHKMSFLVVGVGKKVGSTTTRGSPVLEIINSLELEGALVVKFDMFIEEYAQIPSMHHNSGLRRFDGILVMHPYLISEWECYDYTTFFCRHN